MPWRWATDRQSTAGRLAALTVPVACGLQQNTLLGAKGFKESASGPGKQGFAPAI